eukprot:m.165360 g.165360  ORF g.165360 m.165360 type:complete len:53 (+) comp18137_c0_seq1:464-622(+)
MRADIQKVGYKKDFGALLPLGPTAIDLPESCHRWTETTKKKVGEQAATLASQ